ncbi:hypothetical protein [Streptomyces sp. RKAG290]|uniref:hypothetical protein n=1 Tax=Streptomyces sp. RKAG290 TaxID=2888348 RepID=UPI0020345DE8|nr:hypothetical protein [Streptomyces sp. RKAG290]MCM2416406.1 hypothetical protein [Streptomyces sp. RKAG290]
MNDDVHPMTDGAARPAAAQDLRATGQIRDAPVSRRRILQIAAAAAAAGATTSFWQPAHAAEPDGQGGFSVDRFARPPADSMPLILWFWNGTVTTDLVDTTLADMRAKGVSEVLVFPFDITALRPAFFTEAWFDIVEHTLREADRHHMHIWLFNDDFFPSGRAGGFVVNGGKVGDRTYSPRPDLRTKGVQRSSTRVAAGVAVPLTGQALSVADGRLVVDAAAFDGVRVLKEGAGWTDYTVSATVRIDSGTAGLLVRCSDAKNGYLADLRNDGGVDLWRQTDGTSPWCGRAPPSPASMPASTTASKSAYGARTSSSRLTAPSPRRSPTPPSPPARSGCAPLRRSTPRGQPERHRGRRRGVVRRHLRHRLRP